MYSISDTIKFFAAMGGLVAGYIFGEMDGLFIALLIFIVIDYLTGVIAAIYNRKLSSEVGFKGILKKIMILILVAVAHVIDQYVMHCGSSCRTAVIFFYLANEGISILENVSRLDLPVPEKLKKVLEQIKEKDENNT